MADGITPPIVLIGGTGRSGTNITKEILGMHSRMYALPFEHRITVDPDGLVDFYNSFTNSWSPYLVDRRVMRLEAFLHSLARRNLWHFTLGKAIKLFDPRGKRLSPASYCDWSLHDYFPNYIAHVDALVQALVSFRYRASWVGTPSYTAWPEMRYSPPQEKVDLALLLGSFINKLVADCLRQKGRGIFVEDNTWNILFARDLLDFTPQAKLLHVYRDPRDVVASLTHQRWAPNEPRQVALWVNDIMRVWHKVKASLPARSYLEVSLESIVANTKTALEGICSFIGVEPEPVMFDLDLSRAHIGRWKAELSREDARGAQEVLNEWIDEYGYA
ncbi:MAG: sulfotransferase [Anaerolineales bacterium]